jgi:hypothetical protein
MGVAVLCDCRLLRQDRETFMTSVRRSWPTYAIWASVQRWNWPACAIWVWVVACSVIAGLAYFYPRPHTVFPIYAIASREWWAGGDMFLRQAQTHEIYRYSPVFAVLTSPFAVLPQGLGNASWKLVNAGVFLVGLWVWCRRGLPVQPSRNQIAMIFLLAAPVTAGSLYNGQANLIVTGFILLGLTAAAEDRWWRVAGYLAAATLIKGFPIALALVLCVLFWRTFPLRFLAALAVGLALPFATQQPEYAWEQTARWFSHLTESVELNRERLRSLDKLLEVSGVAVERQLFMLFAAAAGAVVLGAAVWVRWRGADRRETLYVAGAWFLTWVLLFSPSSENATFAILAPIMAWTVVDAFARPTGWLRRAWLLACFPLFGPQNRHLGPYLWLTIGTTMFQVVLIADLLFVRFGNRPENRNASLSVNEARPTE